MVDYISFPPGSQAAMSVQLILLTIFAGVIININKRVKTLNYIRYEDSG